MLRPSGALFFVMNIQLVSDLHLDFHDITLPGGDVLILAGDICEAKELGKNNYNKDWILSPKEIPGKRVDRYLRFFNEEVTKYRKVFYIAGNHEHYGTKYYKTHVFMRENVPSNTTVLENDAVEFEGVLFIGATFWTDFNKGDALTMWNAGQRMNDYKSITVKDGQGYHKMSPKNALLFHLESKQFFENKLNENKEKKLPVVVITHHAPTSMSIPSWYKGDHLMNGNYCSDQSEIILNNPEIKYWVHGHTHDDFKYQVGDTWVMCNPRGYYGHESRANSYAPAEFEI